MPTVTDTELKELKDLITTGFSRLDSEITGLKIGQERLSGQITSLDEKLTGQINSLDEKFTGQINSLDEKLTGQINSLDEKLTGKINVLDEKITGQGKRLDFQEFINRSILGGLILIVLGGAAKYLGIMPTP
jgi:chromosome segregation ATPase